MYDTLKYAKELERAGFSRAQAEAQVTVLKEMVMDGVATKADLERVESRLNQKISDVHTGLHGELSLLRSEMSHGFSRMVIRFGGMNIIGFTLLIAVLQWLQ